MMDPGYIVIGIFVGIIAMVVWSCRGRWNGKRDHYRHTALKGHRQEGSYRSQDGGGSAL